ncbi:YoaK family protein [Amnibacterium kyonggiense]
MLRDQGRLHLGLMLTLTFSTGVVDAIGYLGLDKVFTANMTGNVVILAMGLTGQDGLPIVGPVVALAGFVIGAGVAGRLLRGVPKGWHRRDTVVLSLVAALLLVALIPTAFITATPARPELGLPVTALLAVAMGMQAGTARHVGVVDVTTVVITSTLAALAFDSRLGRSTGQTWFRRLAAVVLLALGALSGAALLLVAFWVGLALAAVLLVAVAALGALGGRAARSRAPDPA